MIERRLEELWSNLQGKKPQLPHFLSEIRLDSIRGLNDLRVVFDYPVSVDRWWERYRQINGAFRGCVCL